MDTTTDVMKLLSRPPAPKIRHLPALHVSVADGSQQRSYRVEFMNAAQTGTTLLRLTEFCRQHNLSTSTLYQHVRHLRKPGIYRAELQHAIRVIWNNMRTGRYAARNAARRARLATKETSDAQPATVLDHAGA